MLICMSRSWNVNTRTKPECWYFNWGTYIFACHASPSCTICFVTSLTKIRLSKIKKNLHFRMIWQLCHDIIASRHECEDTPTTAPQPMSIECVPNLFTLMLRCDINFIMSHRGVICKQRRHALIGWANSVGEISDYVTRHVTVFGPTVMHHFS